MVRLADTLTVRNDNRGNPDDTPPPAAPAVPVGDILRPRVRMLGVYVARVEPDPDTGDLVEVEMQEVLRRPMSEGIAATLAHGYADRGRVPVEHVRVHRPNYVVVRDESGDDPDRGFEERTVLRVPVRPGRDAA